MELLNTKRARVRITHRPASSWMGRFGGGWQWKVGVQADGKLRCVIISLLIADLRIDRPRA